MSISVALAVTMMIGTEERARIDRQTSRPEILGNITSRRIRSGSLFSKHSSASDPSRATVTANPSRSSPRTSASMNDSSSSASRTWTVSGVSPGHDSGVGCAHDSPRT